MIVTTLYCVVNDVFVVRPFVLVPKVIIFEKVNAIISLFHIFTCGIRSLAILIVV